MDALYSEKHRKDIIQKYATEMEFIKIYTDHIINDSKSIIHIGARVEYKALQLRKIIELIIMASLVANSDQYMAFYNRLGSVWNIKYICTDLKKINEDYFPKAIELNKDNGKISFIEDTIQSEEIMLIHEKMGKFLHATNPYGTMPNYIEAEKYIDDSLMRIMKLLNSHLIRLIDDIFLLVFMASSQDGHPVVYWLGKNFN